MAAETTAGVEQPAPEPMFPPFNTETFAPQLVWLAITFIAFFLIMSRIALPKVARVMADREERIADDLDEAERMRKQAEEVEQQYQAALAEARAKAQEALNKAKDDIRAKTDAMSEKLDEKLDKKIAEAEERIAKSRAQALEGLEEMAREVAASVVTQVGGDEPAKTKLDAAVKKASAEKREAA